MGETPTAATMRLDGGHPALDLVNTIYGQVGGPVEHDVLAGPEDLLTFARRVGLATPATRSSEAAWHAAVALRDALDPVLRARLVGEEPPEAAREAVEHAARAALAAGRLAPGEDGRTAPAAPGEDGGTASRLAPDVEGGALVWAWPDDDPFAPVHRLAHAAAGLLTDPEAMAVLHCCAGCCWLFLDRSRGAGRRWCSMADCGTEAKKRRYVQRRRERRATRGSDTRRTDRGSGSG
jgi:predicted RNA-binding Zn ribbon-like protein